MDEALEALGIKLDGVINLNVSDEEVVKRISGRRVCLKCGKTYSIDAAPPKHEDICDGCGSKVVQREDDNEITVRERLNVYHEQTSPLIGYYERKGILLQVPDIDDIEGKSKIIFDLLGKEE